MLAFFVGLDVIPQDRPGKRQGRLYEQRNHDGIPDAGCREMVLGSEEVKRAQAYECQPADYDREEAANNADK